MLRPIYDGLRAICLLQKFRAGQISDSNPPTIHSNLPEEGGGMSLGDLPMNNEDLPHRKARRINSAADEIVSDGALELLSPHLLEEFDDDESPSNEVLRLLEENARLRALTVELSNLLGDLPNVEWGAALTCAEAIRSIRRKIAT